VRREPRCVFTLWFGCVCVFARVCIYIEITSLNQRADYDRFEDTKSNVVY